MKKTFFNTFVYSGYASIILFVFIYQLLLQSIIDLSEMGILGGIIFFGILLALFVIIFVLLVFLTNKIKNKKK
jgi:hypothetical protein